jgi:hypothetical protein
MLELLTMLGPKPQNLNGTGGGIPLITSQDVAASLSRIKITGPSLLVRTMAGDPTTLRSLIQAFRQHVAHMAALKHWKTGPKYNDYFEGLCESVLHFYLKPRICYRCKGHAFVTLRTGQIIDCPVCVRLDEYGARVAVIDTMEKDKARAAGIPIETWLDTWQDRYRAARDILTAWESEADSAVKRVRRD